MFVFFFLSSLFPLSLSLFSLSLFLSLSLFPSFFSLFLLYSFSVQKPLPSKTNSLMRGDRSETAEEKLIAWLEYHKAYRADSAGSSNSQRMFYLEIMRRRDQPWVSWLPEVTAGGKK
jgi:hypothetical protein